MISKTGKEMLAFQERLAKEYKYKPIGFNLFVGDVRRKYIDNLPEWCGLSGSRQALYTHNGAKIANGYKRIVIGDYGAFVEISNADICESELIIKPGEEYRLTDEKFSERVKYIWYTDKSGTGAKFYLQKKTVNYADYRPGMWYVSPYEVTPFDSIACARMMGMQVITGLNAGLLEAKRIL